MTKWKKFDGTKVYSRLGSHKLWFWEGDKQWFGAHGPEIPAVVPSFNGGYFRVLRVKFPAVFEDFAFFL